MSARDLLNQKPWIGYLVVVLVLAAVAYAYWALAGTGGVRDTKRLGEIVTIKDAETGEEWTVVRGKMELELIQRSADEELSPKIGLSNPKTGKLTGFPVDGSWEETVYRIAKARAEASTTQPTPIDK